jgi:hypothetical protein
MSKREQLAFELENTNSVLEKGRLLSLLRDAVVLLLRERRQ